MKKVETINQRELLTDQQTYFSNIVSEVPFVSNTLLPHRCQRVSSSNTSHSLLKTAIVIQDDSLPAAPPPQIRILKRPSSNGSLGYPSSQNRPTPQVKSLAQREAEYAEARKRILGSASPEESPQEKPNTER